MNHIRIATACFLNDEPALLVVRKKNTGAWMLPGGKQEHGETAAECAVREVREELGVTIPLERIEPMGEFETRAANEAGFALRASVFRTRDAIEPHARAEIEAVRWIDPAVGIDDEAEAPLNREFIFPMLIAERSARR